MDREFREPSALVLGLEPYGEGFLRLTLLGREHGLQTVLLRQSRQKSPPDLFDCLEVQWQQRSAGGPGFAGEFRLLRRFENLGLSWAALKAASAHARIIVDNAAHLEDPAPIHDLTLRLLENLQAGAPPGLASLKALYLLARSEGFPVKEAWLARLTPDLRRRTIAALQASLAAQASPDADEALASLRHWLQREADFHLL